MTKQEALENIIVAWESLEGNTSYSPAEIQRWLIEDMKPAIDDVRKCARAGQK